MRSFTAAVWFFIFISSFDIFYDHFLFFISLTDIIFINSFVFLIADFDSRMISWLDSSFLYFNQDGLGQNWKNLIDVITSFCWTLHKCYSLFFGKSKTFLIGYFSTESINIYSACLSLLLPTKTNVKEGGPLDFAYSNHLAMCKKLSRLQMS